jgi:hypothetical protein
MPANDNPSRVGCPSCSECSLHGNLRYAGVKEEGGHFLSGPACNQADDSTAGEGSLRGTRFALASLGLFLVPVSLALTGAILSMSNWGRSVWNASDPSGQLLGATSGMLIGTLGTIVGARVLQAHSLEDQPLEFKSLE